MIHYMTALAAILERAGNPITETAPLMQACGRVAAARIISPMSVPSFRNSAMDGYAVRSRDLAGACPQQPVTLPVSGVIAAGDTVRGDAEGQAVQIMTGAPVPAAFDAVVPVELVTADAGHVTFTRPSQPKDNIRNAGEDVQAGETALAAGDRITPETVMFLAALGIRQVTVFRLPALHIFSTGREVTDATDAPLPQGKIHNANAPYLMACAAREGLEAEYEGVIEDDSVAFEQTLGDIPAGSIIISTGAVSKGEWDFIPDSLKRLGAQIHFHRVHIRPGKPVLFATLPNGSVYFGLPGNPISAAIGYRFFIQPLLRKLQGQQPERPVMARLDNNFIKKGDFRQFLKANLYCTGDGRLHVRISQGQESFRIRPMAESNAWVMLQENQREWQAGEPVPVYPYAAFIQQRDDKEYVLCRVA